MDLPGEQDALIRAVAAANPRTVVVVDAGAPVSMPWADDVAAVLQLWFPGQECGQRSPTCCSATSMPRAGCPPTFPRRLEDTPASNYPGRAGSCATAKASSSATATTIASTWSRASALATGCRTPRSTTPTCAPAAERCRGPAIDVTNTGPPPGRRSRSGLCRDRQAGSNGPSNSSRSSPSCTWRQAKRAAHFQLPSRAFAYWDIVGHRWLVEPGEFDILVGSSSRAIHARASVTLEQMTARAASRPATTRSRHGVPVASCQASCRNGRRLQLVQRQEPRPAVHLLEYRTRRQPGA